jgi:hypothetical protein
MKKLFLLGALAAMLVMGMGGTAMAAEVEAVVFDVQCVLPTFPADLDFTTCGGGLSDPGVGTAFVGLNGNASATGVAYNEPNCAIGNATGTFGFGGASGDLVYRRVGALAVINLSNINGAGFTGGTGAALAVFHTTTIADGQKLVAACLGTPQTNLGVTVTGVGVVADAN